MIIDLKLLDEDLYLKSELRLSNPPQKVYDLPSYQTEGAAGVDLKASETLHVLPNTTRLVGTGIAVHINDRGLMGLIVPRSGLGHKEGIILGNTVGVIDSDYQGEILLSIWNRNPDKIIYFQRGDRLAQLIFVPVVQVSFNLVDDFNTETKRGKGRHGSTGKT